MENNNNIITEITGKEKKAWITPALTKEIFTNTQSGAYAVKIGVENAWYIS